MTTRELGTSPINRQFFPTFDTFDHHVWVWIGEKGKESHTHGKNQLNIRRLVSFSTRLAKNNASRVDVCGLSRILSSPHPKLLVGKCDDKRGKRRERRQHTSTIAAKAQFIPLFDQFHYATHTHLVASATYGSPRTNLYGIGFNESVREIYLDWMQNKLIGGSLFVNVTNLRVRHPAARLHLIRVQAPER